MIDLFAFNVVVILYFLFLRFSDGKIKPLESAGGIINKTQLKERLC